LRRFTTCARYSRVSGDLQDREATAGTLLDRAASRLPPALPGALPGGLFCVSVSPRSQNQAASKAASARASLRVGLKYSSTARNSQSCHHRLARDVQRSQRKGCIPIPDAVNPVSESLFSRGFHCFAHEFLLCATSSMERNGKGTVARVLRDRD